MQNDTENFVVQSFSGTEAFTEWTVLVVIPGKPEYFNRKEKAYDLRML